MLEREADTRVAYAIAEHNPMRASSGFTRR